MLVLDPIGMIDVEGQPVEAAPEQGRGVDAAFDVRDDVLEAHEAAGRSRWIVDINPHDVRQIVRGLRVEELGVLRAELFEHVRSPTPSSRSEEHTSELQSLMRISYAVFCLKKKTKINIETRTA